MAKEKLVDRLNARLKEKADAKRKVRKALARMTDEQHDVLQEAMTMASEGDDDSSLKAIRRILNIVEEAAGDAPDDRRLDLRPG